MIDFTLNDRIPADNALASGQAQEPEQWTCYDHCVRVPKGRDCPDCLAFVARQEGADPDSGPVPACDACHPRPVPVTRDNAETVQRFHPASACSRPVTLGPRGGLIFPRGVDTYRRNGRTQTWKREPARFSISLKFGLRSAGRLTEWEAERDSWHAGEPAECAGSAYALSLREVGLR